MHVTHLTQIDHRVLDPWVIHIIIFITTFARKASLTAVVLQGYSKIRTLYIKEKHCTLDISLLINIAFLYIEKSA